MIKDKVVIITGASSGIGEATAKLLASRGAKVVLGARRGEQLKQLVDEIQNAGGQAVYQVMDVTNPSDNVKIVELAKETFGGVDVIFLNAGKLRAIGLSNFEQADLDNILESCSVKPMVNQILAHISNTPVSCKNPVSLHLTPE